MLTEKDYCDYYTTVALEELGFPLEEDYGGVYIKSCGYKRPSLYEAQKWLREEKNIHVVPELGLIHRNKNGITHYYRVLVKDMDNGIIIILDNDRDDFESYEEALSEGVKCAVEILKEK